MNHYTLISLAVIVWLSFALWVIVSEVRSDNWPKYKIAWVDFTPTQFSIIWLLWPIWFIPLAIFGVLSGNVWRSLKEDRALRRKHKYDVTTPAPVAPQVSIDRDIASLYPAAITVQEPTEP